LLGAYFGYLLVWSRTIWLPILAHFLHNGIAVIAFYLHFNGYIGINPDEVGVNDMLWTSTVFGILFLGILYVIRQKRIQ
jgi:membrane protease YdiL (CAAX protease family)